MANEQRRRSGVGICIEVHAGRLYECYDLTDQRYGSPPCKSCLLREFSPLTEHRITPIISLPNCSTITAHLKRYPPLCPIFDTYADGCQGMGRLTESFSHLESRAEAIGATQSQQAETQYRLHDQMEVQMQVTQGYLSDVTNKASRLQEAVSRTASEIQSLTAFTQLFSTVYDWTIIISGCILLGATGLFLRALWRFNHTIACCVAAAISTVPPTRTLK